MQTGLVVLVSKRFLAAGAQPLAVRFARDDCQHRPEEKGRAGRQDFKQVSRASIDVADAEMQGIDQKHEADGDHHPPGDFDRLPPSASDPSFEFSGHTFVGSLYQSLNP